MNLIVSAGKLFWKVFSSTKTAIFVIIVLGVMLGYGTIVESKHNNNDYAQAVVYHTWWYQGWVLIFLTNLICGTLKKLPWRLSQIPWLCTHLSILLIITGAVLTHFFGENGVVEIVEGKSSNLYTLKDHRLVIEFPKDIDPKTSRAKRYSFPTDFHIFHTDLTPDKVFEIPEKKFKLTVTKFLPFPEKAEHYMEDMEADSLNPAILLKLHTSTKSEDAWMLSQEKGKNHFSWGPYSLYFQDADLEHPKPLFMLKDSFKATLDQNKISVELKDEFEARQCLLSPNALIKVIEPANQWEISDFSTQQKKYFIQRNQEELVVSATPLVYVINQLEDLAKTATLGTLTATWKEGNESKTKSFKLTADLLKKQQDIGDYSFRWLDYWPEVGLEKGSEPYMKGVEPVRPGLKVQVFGPKGFEFYRIIEAKEEHVFEKDYPDVSFSYQLPENKEHLGKDEIIFLKNNHKLSMENAHTNIKALVRTRFNTFELNDLSLFKKIPIQHSEYHIELLDAKAKAVPALKLKSRGYSMSVNPVIAFKVDGIYEKPYDPFFLMLGAYDQANTYRLLSHNGEPVKISYLYHVKSFKFQLKLDKFIKETYEGTDKASGFESQVTVIEPNESKGKKHRIFMNNTLDYGGYRFFQSAYNKTPDGKWQTILEVNKDPGYIFLAIGWILMCLSMLALYYVKPYLIRIETQRKAEKKQQITP